MFVSIVALLYCSFSENPLSQFFFLLLAVSVLSLLFVANEASQVNALNRNLTIIADLSLIRVQILYN